MRLLLLLLITLAFGCPRSADPTPTTRTTTTGPADPEVPAPPVFDLHEWGLVSTGPHGFEFAAGPGQRSPGLAVEKPVLYVHATAAMALQVTVTPGEAMTIAEHWPPTAGAPLSWNVEVTPGPCAAPGVYPSRCQTADGYCETAELALYETTDAACLTHGHRSLPLLFYRMRTGTPPPMPVEVRSSGDDVVVRNRSYRDGIGGIWRVRWDAQSQSTHAARIDLPAVGADAEMPMPTAGGVEMARDALRRDLGAHGLTLPETQAFMRAWDTALFGAAGSVEQTPEMPTRHPAVAEETTPEMEAMANGPRVADAIVYWLPQSDIEGLAKLEVTPAPRHLRRAILVRAHVR